MISPVYKLLILRVFTICNQRVGGSNPSAGSTPFSFQSNSDVSSAFCGCRSSVFRIGRRSADRGALAGTGKGPYSVVLIKTSAGIAKLAYGPLIYAVSVAFSSALLFVVQPILAKSLLPRFGGSAGVWIACLLFFQVALLLGYFYAFCLTRYLSAKAQALVHFGLLTLSVGALRSEER